MGREMTMWESERFLRVNIIKRLSSIRLYSVGDFMLRPNKIYQNKPPAEMHININMEGKIIKTVARG